MMLAQRLGLPEIVGRVLAARGVDAETAPRFLAPALRDWLPDPSAFRDMDRAVARVLQAIQRGERVAVFGDYDVDGATSSALLHRFFRAAGLDLVVYIPDRLSEGYGPNAAALRRLKDEGAAVVITVDCGITAFEALDSAATAGLDVIVLDHHEAEPRLPTAAAVVNPNRLDESDGFGYLAAVGVTFLFVVALNRALRAAGWYRDDRAEPDLLDWLDLVALGTVCDVVPLQGLNRAFVAQGLKVLAGRRNAGLRALADTAGVNERPDAYHLGYLLGPRVNAGGRVGEAGLGARLLASDDPAESGAIAARLDALNVERRAIERRVQDEAVAAVEVSGAGDCVVATGEGWHPGVIGIVAARLRERFDRPACVVALDGGIGKGSGRSVPGVDLGAAIIAARQKGLLIDGGGHAMAAGFTVDRSALPDFRDFLVERIGAAIARIGYVPSIGVDGLLAPGAATPQLVRQLARAGPFGAGNPEPRFALPSVRVGRADVVGDGHVRCFLGDAHGGSVKAIAFRAAGEPLGDALLRTQGAVLHVAGHLRADNWQGRDGSQIIIEDGALPA